MIDRDETISIAMKNAGQVYRDLSVYRVEAVLKEGKWYVDFEFADKDMDGGGPHFVIDAETGEIIGSRFDQ